MAKPYILNTIARIAHVRGQLTEECNTDQIVKRRDSDTLPKSYRLCQHCGAPLTIDSAATPL